MILLETEQILDNCGVSELSSYKKQDDDHASDLAPQERRFHQVKRVQVLEIGQNFDRIDLANMSCHLLRIVNFAEAAEVAWTLVRCSSLAHFFDFKPFLLE